LQSWTIFGILGLNDPWGCFFIEKVRRVEVGMKYASTLFLFLSACCASIACGTGVGGQRVGGSCEYRRIHGRATITAVRDADPEANNCTDAVEVIFDFAPDDISTREHYRLADHPDTGQYLRVGAGMNPPRAWARRKGLVTGAVHRCVRSEIVQGACTPVVFTFPDIDMTGWEKNCFE
jgi:hypothetical protein